MEKKDVKLLRELLLESYRKSESTYQLFDRLFEILKYLEGNNTEEFNCKIRKEYNALKEMK